MARPPSDRTELITVRLSPEDKRRLIRRAKGKKMPPAEMAWRMLSAQLATRREQAEAEAARQADLQDCVKRIDALLQGVLGDLNEAQETFDGLVEKHTDLPPPRGA